MLRVFRTRTHGRPSATTSQHPGGTSVRHGIYAAFNEAVSNAQKAGFGEWLPRFGGTPANSIPFSLC